jgi:hypothetical protein
MSHVGQDDLVLHYYGEGEAPSAIEIHLKRCDACRSKYVELERTLGLVDRFDRAVMPELDPSYGRRVWLEVSTKLPSSEGKATRRSFRMPMAAAAALAAALAIAFVTGLLIGRGDVVPQEPPIVATQQRAEDRALLLIAVADHLARSERLLVELVNTTDADPELDRQREHAARLASANRVFRRGAAGAGEAGVAEVLEQLEHTLLEIAHGSGESARQELDDLRRRIERRGILTKIRVLGNRQPRVPLDTGPQRAGAAV